MLLFKDKINYKSPHGNGFHAHLDAPAYDHISATEHMTTNFAIDAATPANGCLEVVTGSHKIHKSIPFSDGGRIADSWCETQQWTQVPLAPGDVLIFGSHLAHRSAANNTEQRRASLYATFAGKADGEELRRKYYEHRRIAFPPDHERIPEVDYGEGWKTYGFAAPFSREGIEATVKTVVAQ
jgi:2-aminoethylphosphonate dioxygenase